MKYNVKNIELYIDEYRLLLEDISRGKTQEILARAKEICHILIIENDQESQALKKHTHSRIYPCIGLFKAMVENGMTREEAALVIHKFYEEQSSNSAKKMANLLRFPLLYKIIPRMAYKTTVKTFGKKAGFKAQYYITSKDELKFDMLECPYYEICKRYDCIEIVTAFCDSDDVAYGNLHEKILWHRTKTLGRGDSCCDFNIKLKK